MSEKTDFIGIYRKLLPKYYKALENNAQRSGLTAAQAATLLEIWENPLYVSSAAAEDIARLTEKGLAENGKITSRGAIIAKSFSGIKDKFNLYITSKLSESERAAIARLEELVDEM